MPTFLGLRYTGGPVLFGTLNLLMTLRLSSMPFRKFADYARQLFTVTHQKQEHWGVLLQG
jgi:hypothetical protein